MVFDPTIVRWRAAVYYLRSNICRNIWSALFVLYKLYIYIYSNYKSPCNSKYNCSNFDPSFSQLCSGLFRKQNITKFGHVHYIQEDGYREIFFEKNDFNIGLPYSGDDSRVNIRSESVMKLVYQQLGRSPCPNELAFWKYRTTDFDEWQYDRQS